MKRLALLLGGLFGAAFVLAAPAAAHARLVTSEPADGARLKVAPHTVTLTFDEGVGIDGLGYVHVTDRTGRRVDVRPAYHPGGAAAKVAVDLRAGLGDGTYTASYRLISDDSHPVAGSIAFVVGTGPLVRGAGPGGAVNPVTGDALDLVRWVSFAGLALLGGGWLLFTIWPAGCGERRARRLVWRGWAALAVGTGFELLLQGPYTAGAGPGRLASGALLDDTVHTEYGQLHILRLALLAVLAAVLARSLRPGARSWRTDAGAGALGVAVVWTFSRAGHAETTSPAWLSVAVDMAHLLAMATWLGGLLMLVVAVFPRRDNDELRSLLPTVSTVAFTAVGVLVASGVYSAWRGIGSVHAIFATTYGLIVLCKVVLLAGILTVANLSRRLVQRRAVAYAMTDTVAAASPEFGADEIETERLRRSVWVEAVVALVVLGFSAVLVGEPRGTDALHAPSRAAAVAHVVETEVPVATGRP